MVIRTSVAHYKHRGVATPENKTLFTQLRLHRRMSKREIIDLTGSSDSDTDAPQPARAQRARVDAPAAVTQAALDAAKQRADDLTAAALWTEHRLADASTRASDSMRTHADSAADLLAMLSLRGRGVVGDARRGNRAVDKVYDDNVERLEVQADHLKAIAGGITRLGVVPDPMPTRSKATNAKLGKMFPRPYPFPSAGPIAHHDLVARFGVVDVSDGVHLRAVRLRLHAVKYGCVEFRVTNRDEETVPAEPNPAWFSVRFQGEPVVIRADLDALCCARRLQVALPAEFERTLLNPPFTCTAAYFDAPRATFVVRFYATFGTKAVWPAGLQVVYDSRIGDVASADVPAIPLQAAREAILSIVAAPGVTYKLTDAGDAVVTTGTALKVYVQVRPTAPCRFPSLRSLQQALSVSRSAILFLEAPADVHALFDLIAMGWFHRDLQVRVLPAMFPCMALPLADLNRYSSLIAQQPLRGDCADLKTEVFDNGLPFELVVNTCPVSQVFQPLTSLFPKQFGPVGDAAVVLVAEKLLLRNFIQDVVNLETK